MTDKQDPEHNIISFPGSADRLSKEGLEELRNGSKEKAVSLFSEALQHDSRHEEASYGLLLGLAETGQLNEGISLAENMMDGDDENYFEVLQVYVSLLAQKGEYHKVVTVLEGVQEEHRFPAKMAEQLFELLELSRTMAETAVEPEIEEQPERDWVSELKSAGGEHKAAILQEMKAYPKASIQPAAQTLLTDSEVSPLLKSMLLFLLKDVHMDGEIRITKLGCTGTFTPDSLPSMEESSSYIKTASCLDKALAHEEPVLLQHCLERLKEIILYYYPFPLSMPCDALAAAVHAEAAEQTGRAVELAPICALYSISEETFCDVKREYDTLKTNISHM
ncbi:tetratricopeptide repeat protein [Salibacterium sp. K-3]